MLYRTLPFQSHVPHHDRVSLTHASVLIPLLITAPNARTHRLLKSHHLRLHLLLLIMTWRFVALLNTIDASLLLVRICRMDRKHKAFWRESRTSLRVLLWCYTGASLLALCYRLLHARFIYKDLSIGPDKLGVHWQSGWVYRVICLVENQQLVLLLDAFRMVSQRLFVTERKFTDCNCFEILFLRIILDYY